MLPTYSFDKNAVSLMPKRRTESNKGDYGRVLCICGSVGMCGAATLSAKAAYRTGAGLVDIFTPEENRVPLQISLPEAIVTAYNEKELEEKLRASVKRADSIVVGCGLGGSDLSEKLLTLLLPILDKPRVIDADALNIISKNEPLKKYLKGAVITPHPLEFSRLSHIPVEDILRDTPAAAQKFARTHGTVCVLKTHATAVSDGGEPVYVNNSGNNGMATGGSGDVLAGIIGGLLAQGKNSTLSLSKTAALGVYIHGKAGDIAAARLGEYSLMASDIIDAIPEVLKN